MALLGYQVVISLIMASVIQKIGKHYSFAKWMICNTGLVRYLYPTDSELRQLAGVPKEINKKKKDKRYHENGHISSSQVFHVPRNLELELENAKVGILDVIHLRFFQDYQMLLDFALYSLIVYILTEMFSYVMPLKDEINLSMVWCMLVVLFSTKILVNLTLQYFTGEESIGERSTVIVTFFAYLLLAMVILLINEENLETGLDEAYRSFNESANSFLERHGLNSEGPASKLILKFSIALWCALIGALFTFPGLRVARMHWDSLRDCGDKRVLAVFLNLNFAAPFFLVLLWLRPVTKHYLTVRVFSGMQSPIMTENAFDILRILLIVVVVLLRVALMPFYLQAYLNIAERRVQEQRREAGRITNKDLQKKIAAVFYYMCVVALQYIAPILLCLFFGLMYKTLGEYSWSNIFDTIGVIIEEECPVEAKPPAPLGEEDSVLRSAQDITLAIGSLKQVLTKEVARGVFGFATWWVCFSWFCSSALGLIYQSYFTQV